MGEYTTYDTSPRPWTDECLELKDAVHSLSKDLKNFAGVDKYDKLREQVRQFNNEISGTFNTVAFPSIRERKGLKNTEDQIG